MKKTWPPIIGADHLPWWAYLRDVLLTLGAWGVLIYLLRTVLTAIWNQAMFVLGFSDAMPSRLQIKIWNDLQVFLQVAAVLVVWLLFWALWRYRWLVATEPVYPQPYPLEQQRHAAYFGITSERSAGMQQALVAEVHFDEQGRMLDEGES